MVKNQTKKNRLEFCIQGKTMLHEDLNVLRDAFTLFDKNGNNEISYNDMKAFLELLGEEIPEKRLRQVFLTPMSFESFCQFVQSPSRKKIKKRRNTVATSSNSQSLVSFKIGKETKRPKTLSLRKSLGVSAKISELRQVFKRFDLQDVGELNVRETAAIMSRLGLAARQESVADLFRMVNELYPKKKECDKKETLNFEQFLVLVRKM